MKVQFEGVQHYVGRLFDHLDLKIIVAGIGSIVNLLFGDFTGPLRAFLVLLLIDYITGVIKAIKQERLSSWLSRKGWGKIFTYAVVISLGHLVQQVGIAGARDFAILWAGTTEGISILENFDELGVQIPGFIKEKLLQTKEKKFGDV
jgi:toxin secretion/phage lysis holin